ncbi:MAG: hypothetical protein AABW45_01495 [Nanoarchaeota archaeon]|mgnify:FL=1
MKKSLSRIVKHGRNLSISGILSLISLNAQQQYEPNANVKSLIEIIKKRPTHFDQRLQQYEIREFIDGFEHRIVYIENGDGIVGEGDKFYLIIRRDGKTEYYFGDYNLDGFSTYSVRNFSDSFKAPNEDYNSYKNGILSMDKGDDTYSDFMNEIYNKKLQELIEHFNNK